MGLGGMATIRTNSGQNLKFFTRPKFKKANYQTPSIMGRLDPLNLINCHPQLIVIHLLLEF